MFFFFLMILLPPISTLFPYTTLFRSEVSDMLENKVRGYGHRLLTERRMPIRSEEHTSELQSRGHLVCRLLLEKKNHLCISDQKCKDISIVYLSQYNHHLVP